MNAAQQKHLEFVLGYCVDRLNAAPDDPAVADVANKLAVLKAYVLKTQPINAHEVTVRDIESGGIRIR